ncbi:DNA mismatch repair protein MSH3 [Marchantia polymorpha subsp. ruderalis]|uniref:DNA mismatch repair protein MSH3 n=2 Tax=Marchantia polymorpha TaxID=3197 RepID=A0AAF6AMA5_MARPO|nr:hypothetical protein MARPO_0043s0063 [Marchantia polymorpha]BBM97575.1 hypothetical protein Mp_1g06710 [Marchantia polymorpha subsp. ruderalis]|eukprot:PTQ39816.1 hypothetical protein MARPO_0043s0063 [Marchantia polymorpha]
MKKQQSISRFFTATSTTSSSPSQNDASGSERRNAASTALGKVEGLSPTVEWPPRPRSGRVVPRSANKRTSSHDPMPGESKRRAVEQSKDGGALGSSDPVVSVGILNVQSSKASCMPIDLSDDLPVRDLGKEVTEQRTTGGFPESASSVGDVDNSDVEMSLRSHKDGGAACLGVQCASQRPYQNEEEEEEEVDEESRDGGDDGLQCPEPLAVAEPDDTAKMQVHGIAGALDSLPSLKRRRKGSSSDVKTVQQIPPSNPVMHRRFVEKLLARADSSGDVKESWYGSPPTGKEKYTPLEVQVAELKAKYPDVMLMVEVGYRYRFFGNDAETAAKILGIFAHYDHSFLTASIPTFRLHVHVRRLVEAGCKVGVVRQTETAALKSHGPNKTGPFTRGLTALYTRSTLEAAADLGGESEGRLSRLSSYLMCIAEKPIIDSKGSDKKRMKGDFNTSREADAQRGSYDTELGMVAIEVATGDIMFSAFRDTVMRTELEGRLLACTPVELLLASPLSPQTEKPLMDFVGPTSEVRVERVSRDCFKDGGALAEVVEFYRSGADSSDNLVGTREAESFNEELEVVMRMPDIVVQALALALRYLKQFGLEKVLRLGTTFRPFFTQNEMNLSPNAIRQLEILKNNADGSEKGSLLWLLDQTQTSFGARLLRHWVTHPLCNHEHISARLDAVTEIAESVGCAAQTTTGPFSGSSKAIGNGGAINRLSHGVQGLIGAALNIVGRMPDLERGITRIFHRTATAAEFVSVMQALVTCSKHFERALPAFEPVNHMREDDNAREIREIKSPLLQRLISAVSSEAICEHANRLLSALNTDAAQAGDKLNLFNCEDGRFSEVLAHRKAIKVVEKELDGFLPAFRTLLRLPNLQYMSVNGSTYLVEAPVAQRVPGDWIKVNSTKKTHRYHPPNVLKSLQKLAVASEQLTAACTRAWDMFLEEFSSHYVEFRASVQALAALDCLHSLAVVSRNQGYTRPEFVGEDEPSQFGVEAGRHPILDSTLQELFVPNDTNLHAQKERCQIITGPNMGGKSCYIRQVALIAIMAQVGSYVPASSAKLHVFDSVHTRMGASDSLQKGSSTFLEELSEASAILRSASSRSLVIVDELGRGTSTHDGVALAYATLHHMLREIQCLTLFVTHYPKIADLRDEFPGIVNPYFVSYLAQDSAPCTQATPATDGKDQDQELDSRYVSEAAQDVTFLYKLVPGVASKSFGLYVAKIAQIPESCIITASSMALKLEKMVCDREHRRAATMCNTQTASQAESSAIEAITKQQMRLGDENIGAVLGANKSSDWKLIADPGKPVEAICPTDAEENLWVGEHGQSPMKEAEMSVVKDLLQQLERSSRAIDDSGASLVRLKIIQRHVRAVYSGTRYGDIHSRGLIGSSEP